MPHGLIDLYRGDYVIHPMGAMYVFFKSTFTSNSKNQLNVGKYTIHGSYGYI